MADVPKKLEMDAAEFRRRGHQLVDWIAEYFDHPERYAVLARVTPGQIAAALPQSAPEDGQPFDQIMADFERVLVPGLTHWNHPGFLAYFGITASPAGVLGELLSAALNQQAMLWRTSPAATELEQVTLGWLRQLLGLPDAFKGVIYDTASIATLHALIAAREAAVPTSRTTGLAGSRDVPRLAVYCSAEAHSSVDKAVIAIGLGLSSLRKIPVDEAFRLRVDQLATAIENDRADGIRPIAVVATVGTTSTTSVDPVPTIADICSREQVWLHVDAAYGGAAAVLPSHAHVLAGADRADSLVVNPHKWLFTPFDLSAFYTRRMDAIRAAFALTPAYLATSDQESAMNLMDTGIQLGRRFRALKLWMVLRTFGAGGLRHHIERHIELAGRLASWIDAHPDFERLAPSPFSVVCFRWRPAGTTVSDDALDHANSDIVNAVNRSGDVFISHTSINGRFAIRIAIGHLHTTEVHVRRAWELIIEHARALQV